MNLGAKKGMEADWWRFMYVFGYVGLPASMPGVFLTLRRVCLQPVHRINAHATTPTAFRTVTGAMG